MNRQHLKAAAEAFAGINPVESACYHYTHDGFKQVYRDIIIKHFEYVLQPRIKPDYLKAVVNTALIELQYPVKPNSEYAWSSNQRADCAGISRATWSRNQLSDHVNFIINEIRRKSITVWHARNEPWIN